MDFYIVIRESVKGHNIFFVLSIYVHTLIRHNEREKGTKILSVLSFFT